MTTALRSLEAWDQPFSLQKDQGRQLGWYAYFVRNRTVLGSLVTLIHLPFMFAFLSFVLIGALSLPGLNVTVLVLSLIVVSLLLYGEHMLDDMERVGKPWSTVFNDRTLAILAILLFSISGLIGAYASIAFSTVVPFLGVLAGIGFCTLYGLEVWEFHRTVFGGLGMGAIAAFSYLAQTFITGSSVEPLMVILLFALGFVLSYVMLWLYEYTKTEAYEKAWRLLACQLVLIYAIPGVMAWARLA
jgi:hypothetical protein